MSDAPKRLYLQTHDNPNDEFAWTHADHRIHDDDTEYVRADEIERLEAIVKGLEECDAEDKAEIARLETLNLRLAKDAMTDRDEVARLRAALEEAENALLDYVPRLEAYGSVMGYGRGVLRKIREALNDE